MQVLPAPGGEAAANTVGPVRVCRSPGVVAVVFTRGRTLMSESSGAADVLIVGGGSAGAVLAARLSEDST